MLSPQGNESQGRGFPGLPAPLPFRAHFSCPVSCAFSVGRSTSGYWRFLVTCSAIMSSWLGLAIDCVSQWLGLSGAPSSGSVYRISCESLEGSLFCVLLLPPCGDWAALQLVSAHDGLPSPDQALQGLVSSVWTQFGASTPHRSLLEDQKGIRHMSFHRPPEPLAAPAPELGTFVCPQPRPQREGLLSC